MAYNKLKGDVKWTVPGKPPSSRAIAWSTKAASELIVVLAEDYDTIQDVHDHINYDIEAKAVLQAYIDRGYGNLIARELFN